MEIAFAGLEFSLVYLLPVLGFVVLSSSLVWMYCRYRVERDYRQSDLAMAILAIGVCCLAAGIALEWLT